jgi:hypothetical protein
MGLAGDRALVFPAFVTEPDLDLKRLAAVEALRRIREIAAEAGIPAEPDLPASN